MTKQKLIRYAQILGMVVLLMVPTFALAAPNLGLNEVKGGTGLPDWGVQPGGGAESVVRIIIQVIKILLMLAGSIAVLFIIIGGFQFLTAGANPDNAKKGKGTVVNALIGLVIIVLSYVLVTVVASFVGNNP